MAEIVRSSSCGGKNENDVSKSLNSEESIKPSVHDVLGDVSRKNQLRGSAFWTPSSGHFDDQLRILSSDDISMTRTSTVISSPEPSTLHYTSSAALSEVSLPFPHLMSSITSDSFWIEASSRPPMKNEFDPSDEMRPSSPELKYRISNYVLNEATPLNRPSLLRTPTHAFLDDSLIDENFPHELENDKPRTNSQNTSEMVGGELKIAATALLDLTPSIGNRMDTFNGGDKTVNSALATVTACKSHCSPQRFEALRPQKTADITLNPIQRMNEKFVHATEQLLDGAPYTNLACKCKNSQCLKLYCNCFQSGALCDELICKCSDCANTAKDSCPRGKRTRAIYEILNRRIDAFEPRYKKKKGQGCSCKKTRCLQKYCDCYALGNLCSRSTCVCTDCSNIASTGVRKG